MPQEHHLLIADSLPYPTSYIAQLIFTINKDSELVSIITMTAFVYGLSILNILCLALSINADHLENLYLAAAHPFGFGLRFDDFFRTDYSEGASFFFAQLTMALPL